MEEIGEWGKSLPEHDLVTKGRKYTASREWLCRGESLVGNLAGA